MRAICVVLLDGVGDRAYRELGGRSANEAADTPALDELCTRGSCGLLWPLGPGRAPSSERAHWAMLGYREDEFPGRAVIEATGHCIPVFAENVYAYAALRSGIVRDGRVEVTGRVRDDDRVPGAMREVRAHGGLVTQCHYLGRGEGVLELSGDGVDERVTDSDPFFRERDPVLRPLPLAAQAGPTAQAAEQWMRDTFVADGETARLATLKWWGRPKPCPSFAARHGVEGAIVGGSSFLAGLASTLGLGFRRTPETGDHEAELTARLDAAAELIRDGATFVWIHHKGADEAGHSKEPSVKRDAIEALDRALAALHEPPFAEVAVCVTGDHATPTSSDVIHSGDPVPLVVAGPGVRADRVTAWGELSCREGIFGHLCGDDLMPVLLNAADRPLYAGSRPTPVAFPAGHPSVVEPWSVE